MSRTSIPSPRSSGRLARQFRPIAAALTVLAVINCVHAAEDSKAGLVDLGRTDARLKGFHAPAGFRLEIVTDDLPITAPSALVFDDAGRLYVAENTPNSRFFDVWDSITHPDGTKVHLHRRRKATTDQIKRLTDSNGDGRFDTSEVVVEGVEQPTGLIWIKGELLVAASGRLERWTDGEGDGRFETRTVLIDGFGAVDARGLSGLSLGPDGWLYLTTGDNETHAFTPNGARVDLSRTGGLYRCKLDGSNLQLVASGFRGLRGRVAWESDSQPILIDDDGADGSKLAGVRLVAPIEQGDYGWRLLPGEPTPDHELGTVSGDRPGKLTGFAHLGLGAPADALIYGGTLLPEACRGLLIATDPTRHSVRGFKISHTDGQTTLVGETTLLMADDDRFRPERIVVGADSAIYLLGGGGRIFRLSWSAGTKPPSVEPIRKWEQVTGLPNEQLLAQLPSPDRGIAERALRELVDRGNINRPSLLLLAANPAAQVSARVLALQGARQSWSDEVETSMSNLLVDPQPEVRRVAAQALALEPKRPEARVVPRLIERLDDPDPRVVREVALALGRHGQISPRLPGATMVRWLYAHPKADSATRDALFRGLERLGDVGVDEVALAVRTRRGAEREQAVRFYSALRSSHAADELTGLVKIPDLSAAERVILIRQFADFSGEVNPSTTALVDWVVKHQETDPLVKIAALETCRLVGNPASSLVMACLDDEDESVRIAATNFASRTRPPGSMAKLAPRVGDKERSDSERLADAHSLRWGGPAGFAALDEAFLNAEALELRRAALRSMADADRGKAMAALTSTLTGPDPMLKREAIAILGETGPGARVVAKAYLDGTLTRPDLPDVLRTLHKQDADAEVRKALAAVKLDATQGKTALSASAVKLQAVESGNPWAGLEVFFRASARCASCHQVGGQGGQVGPALDLDAHGLSAEKLVESIQHPSRETKPGFEPARLAMAGLALGDTPATARTSKPIAPLAGVDRAKIGSDTEKRPAMPEGLDLDLTPQELADLVAFLLDSTAQAAIRSGDLVTLDRWLVAGPFAPGADSLRLPLDRIELVKPVAGQDGRSLTWLPLTAAADGKINLGGLVAPRPSKAFAAIQVRTAAPQTAWLYASTRGPARVYLGGTKLFDLPDRSIASPDEQPTELARLSLKAGWNLLIVACDPPASGEPIATFRIAGPQPVEIRAPRN